MQPIGIFDSGIGGLTVLSALREMLPHEHFVYFADTAHTPYGEKTPEQLLSYCQDILSWMHYKMGAKLLVAACHTSSVAALPNLPHNTPIPVVGMLEPMATLLHNAKKVGIIATQATVNSGAHETFFRKKGFTGLIHSISCPRIVPFLEEGNILGLHGVLQDYLQPFWTHQLDTLVYGCTHYPFAADLIAKHLPAGVQCINPSFAVAQHVHSLLPPKDPPYTQGSVTFYCSADVALFRKKVIQWTHQKDPEVRLAHTTECAEDFFVSQI